MKMATFLKKPGRSHLRSWRPRPRPSKACPEMWCPWIENITIYLFTKKTQIRIVNRLIDVVQYFAAAFFRYGPVAVCFCFNTDSLFREIEMCYPRPNNCNTSRGWAFWLDGQMSQDSEEKSQYCFDVSRAWYLHFDTMYTFTWSN